MSTQYPTQPPQQYQPTNQPAGIATASVVLGAIGFVVGICSVIGLILGLVARGKAKRGEINPARIKAGIIVSSISLALGVIGWGILFSAIGSGMDTDTSTTSIAAPAETSEEAVAEAPVVAESATEQPTVEQSVPAPAPPTSEAPAPVQTQAAPDQSVAQKNAVRKADSYLEFAAFSRSGLIEQMEFEGFSTDDATYAVDHIDVDWNDQAAKKAASYLDMSSFSRQSLTEQLVFEGFTPGEADYGVSKTGL
ncbi:Ltp family lipoprotein [Kineococcus sp. GCM10028916]|uniref:Ltp family lipoprotein n=1 Tax=Kineococcus sp. GCM10028916 TaxID=3273394 RepID=UPI003640616B